MKNEEYVVSIEERHKVINDQRKYVRRSESPNDS